MTKTFPQPNSHYSGKGPESLSPCHREHYEVAKQFSRPFSPAEFRTLYKSTYPDRKEGSILPSDYCFNRDNKGNTRHPRFLLWDHNKSYRFVGLDRRIP